MQSFYEKDRDNSINHFAVIKTCLSDYDTNIDEALLPKNFKQN